MGPGSDDDTRLIGPCPLCGREMIDGPSINRHHLIPRAHGGGNWAFLHVICHKKIHSVLEDKELARRYHNPEALREHPDIKAFVQWVRKRPPQYVDRHNTPRRR